MPTIQSRTGPLYRVTIPNGASLDAPDFVAKQGATSVVYFVRSTGVLTAEVFRINKDGEERSQSRGVATPIQTNVEEVMLFEYHLRRSRLRFTNNSGADVDVEVDVEQGGAG